MKLSVVIPYYNEERTLREILDRVRHNPTGHDLEIIVIDDCSTDSSRAIAEGVASTDPRFKLLHTKHNSGKGAAVRLGFTAVTGDIVIIQDADLEYNPADYPALIGPIIDGYADCVYGSRFLGDIHRVFYFWHYLGNRTITFCSNIATNFNLTDVETCYKAFKAEILDGMTFSNDGFGFEIEFTVKISKKKLRVYEVPISYFGREYSEGKKVKPVDGIAALWYIAYYRLFAK